MEEVEKSASGDASHDRAMRFGELQELRNDSHVALRQLCAVIGDGLAEPLGTPAASGASHLAFFASSTAQPDNAVINAFKALAGAVVGAADLARERTDEIIATVETRTESDQQPDISVLTQRGQSTLQRLYHDSSS